MVNILFTIYYGNSFPDPYYPSYTIYHILLLFQLIASYAQNCIVSAS